MLPLEPFKNILFLKIISKKAKAKDEQERDFYLKGVFAKTERGYRLTAKNNPKRRKLLKTTYAEERSVHTNLVSCNIQLGS